MTKGPKHSKEKKDSRDEDDPLFNSESPRDAVEFKATAKKTFSKRNA